MRLIPFVAIVALSANPLSAGPDATSQRFLNETPSMMDWGIYKLQRQLLDYKQSGLPKVSYDWDADAIKITRYARYNGEDAEENKQACRSWFSSLRAIALLNPETGAPVTPSGVSGFAELFLHEGIERTVDGVLDTDAIKELDKKFVLEMLFLGDQETSFKTRLTCRADLLGTKIAFEE